MNLTETIHSAVRTLKSLYLRMLGHDISKEDDELCDNGIIGYRR